jgi:hypothetical protein
MKKAAGFAPAAPNPFDKVFRAEITSPRWQILQ